METISTLPTPTHTRSTSLGQMETTSILPSPTHTRGSISFGHESDLLRFPSRVPVGTTIDAVRTAWRSAGRSCRSARLVLCGGSATTTGLLRPSRANWIGDLSLRSPRPANAGRWLAELFAVNRMMNDHQSEEPGIKCNSGGPSLVNVSDRSQHCLQELLLDAANVSM